jgi:hypothetical protein
VDTSDPLEQLIRLLKNTYGTLPFGWKQSPEREPVSAWHLLESAPAPRENSTPHADKSWRAEFEGLYQQLRTLDTTAQSPIVAITGLLNAGKSSLLAGFLSDAGRNRVLIGSANDQGTHRFVLWLPASWKKSSEAWNAAVQQLMAVFGCEPEPLSEDIPVAREQYNGRSFLPNADSAASTVDPRSIPLIATDEKLDRLGIGLLDCPDIQTGMFTNDLINQPQYATTDTFAERSMKVAQQRAGMLIKASHLCSAFLAVVASNSLHEEKFNELLETLRTHMPGVRRIVIVNRVPRRYLASEIADEVQSTYQTIGFDRSYMAYNFQGPLDREKIPQPLPDNVQSDFSSLPIFFQIVPPPVPEPPAPIEPDKYLLNLGKHLDRGRLVDECRGALAQRLANQLQKGLEQLYAELQNRKDRQKRVYQLMADASFEFSRGPKSSESVENSLRLHASREIVQQISASLEKTAPWWARPSRVIVRWTQGAKDVVVNAASSFTPLSWLGQKTTAVVDAIQGQFRRGEVGRVVNNLELADFLRQFDYENDLAEWSQSDSAKDVERRCQRVIDRFQSESRTRLDDKELDGYTTRIWAGMSWQQRLWTGVMPATLVFAPLLAVLALPFDFGGSSVLVLASMKELLFAGLAGVGAALLGGDNMPKLAEDEAAWQQLNDLFALTCDEFGIPRPSEKEFPTISAVTQRRALRAAQVAEARQPETARLPLPIEKNAEFSRRFAQVHKHWMENIKS